MRLTRTGNIAVRRSRAARHPDGAPHDGTDDWLPDVIGTHGDGRRCADVSIEEYHPECGELKDHTTLVAAVKAAGLVEPLEGPGPFTVFAPTNEAFDKLPPGTVATPVKPENKAMLTKILTYHVVPGRFTAANLIKMVQDGEGKATLKTVEGDPLTVTEQGNKLFVSGEKSGVAEVSIADVMQSNGVIHVVTSVLLPN